MIHPLLPIGIKTPTSIVQTSTFCPVRGGANGFADEIARH
jgi:hypothetical protein